MTDDAQLRKTMEADIAKQILVAQKHIEEECLMRGLSLDKTQKTIYLTSLMNEIHVVRLFASNPVEDDKKPHGVIPALILHKMINEAIRETDIEAEKISCRMLSIYAFSAQNKYIKRHVVAVDMTGKGKNLLIFDPQARIDKYQLLFRHVRYNKNEDAVNVALQDENINNITRLSCVFVSLYDCHGLEKTAKLISSKLDKSTMKILRTFRLL